MVSSILRLLKENTGGLSFHSLARGLQLLQREKPLLKTKLMELEDRGLILRVKRSYFLLPQNRVVRGLVIHVGRTFLFVRLEKGQGPNIYVPARHTGGAVLGDTVELVRSEARTEEGPVGKVLRITKKTKNTVVGIYREVWGRAYMVPYDSPLGEEIPLAVPGPRPAEAGNVIEIDRETRRIVRVLGRPDDPGVDIEVVVRKYDLPDAFSSEVLAEAEAVAGSGFDDLGEREDLRDWTVVTIDGVDARDFDDAVSIQGDGKDCFLLGVHIADVSHFVRSGSSLDREAYRRGTSVYFPEKALPMLPEKLSHEKCSLQPGEDRLAVSVLMDVDATGEVLAARIRPSLIRSAARLTYEMVEKIFAGNAEERKRHPGLIDGLLCMRRLAERMRRHRVESGSLDFSHPEPRLRYQDGVLVAVDAFLPQEAHGLIEEFMLAANQAAAVFLEDREVAFPYRVHPPPALKDLATLRTLLGHFGISLPAPEKVEAFHLQDAQEQLQLRPEGKYLSVQILKSLRLASYESRNSGHFGLGKNIYAHFTSPIRRYPDLVSHRALKHVLTGRAQEDVPLAAVARACSERERRAEEAERELLEWRIYRYLRSRQGDEFPGFVVDINKAGLVVELEDLFVTGMVLFQDMGDDYFERDSEISLKGRHTGTAFVLGDRLRVVLASIEPDLRRMILIPAG
jgi:ribonuclease R